MSVPDAKRLRTLETENGRLKQLLAEALLESELTREVLRKIGNCTRATNAGAGDDHGQRPHGDVRIGSTQVSGRPQGHTG
jgi:hypothetical protein